jgi:hypothetical protein
MGSVEVKKKEHGASQPFRAAGADESALSPVLAANREAFLRQHQSLCNIGANR